MTTVPHKSRPLRLAFASVLALTLIASLASAQEPERLPPPEDVTLSSWLIGQGGPVLNLKATYYPGTKGKESAPVVCLHEYKGSRADYADFALQLQKAGHAVLTVDLRGHGQSTTVRGTDRAFTVEELRPADFGLMATQDMEAVKRWLLAKNNAGELNIERLSVVGAEMSTVVAINWAAIDWAWPVLATGKQGQDVKALVLLTPTDNFRGMRTTPATGTPALQQNISFQIVAGTKNRSALSDATKLERLVNRNRPTYTDRDDILRFQSVFFDQPDTEVQGVKLLDPRVQVRDRIIKFLELRTVNPEYPWAMRKDPLGN